MLPPRPAERFGSSRALAARRWRPGDPPHAQTTAARHPQTWAPEQEVSAVPLVAEDDPW
ncbi:hypothetical protein ACFRNT_44760 [Streptomyces sp. NPDC056697]|uniref:hypothetical protein n=1 Tax=Streptomyces sp. NPDC056697 TaxID=3345915 RepID=UPI00367A68A3